MTNVASPTGGLVGNSNYNLYCQGGSGQSEVLTGLSVTIEVTEEIVAVPSAPSVAGEQSNGIGFQLNCFAPTGATPNLWQQYILVVSRTGGGLRWGINNWENDTGAQLINTGDDLFTIPSGPGAGYASIPAGYRFVIELATDSTNQNSVNTATFTAFDGNNQLFPPAVIEMTKPGFVDVNNHQVTAADLGPIADIMLVIGGYANGADTLLASGAGTITYQCSQGLTVANTFPAGVAGGGTAESSNATYGALASGPSSSIVQTFGHTAGSSCVVAQGPGESLEFYWQQIGDSGWNPETVAGPGTTFAAPSIAFSEIAVAVWIAAQGPGNSLDFYWQGIGSPKWNPGTVAGAGTTFSAPSIAQIGDSVCIAVQGPDNSLQFYWQTIGTPKWHQETVVGAGTTLSAPSIAQVGNSACIVVQGPDNSLQFYWQTINTAQWHQETVVGAGTTLSAPSIAQVGNSACIVVQGPDNSLQFYWQTINTAQWHQETVAGAGSATSAPSIAQVGNSTCIAAQGADNSLCFYWQTIGTGEWHQETVAVTGSAFSAPSVAQVGKAACVVVQGEGNSIMFYWQTIGTAKWNPETVAKAVTEHVAALTAAGPPLPPAGGWK